MALSSEEEKLKNFTGEAMNDAKKISGEIKERTKREFREKLDAGEKKIIEQMDSYIRHETEKIKKEKSLEISHEEIKIKQDYFRHIDSIASRVFETVARKLIEFKKSEEYTDYLVECCKNVMEKTGTDIDVFYMPEDEELVTVKVKDKLGGIFDAPQTKFKSDETIKTGGLRFFCGGSGKNVYINDVFDEKTERAKELLHAIIGPQFMGVR
jgi:hypothetical protein